MKVTVIQPDIFWQRPKENQERVAAMLDSAPGTDLFVLPEMWATGFVLEPETAAESTGEGSSLEWMKRQCVNRGCAMSGSLSVKAPGGKYVNRHYFVTPDGSFFVYDKRHLFSYGGEHRSYTRGERRVVAHWGGMRWLLATCYDLRFPLWLRYRDDYDGILLVANWPASRRDAWQTLLRARAIENQCFVVAANRCGNDPVCGYAGYSAIIDAKGQPLAEAGCTPTTLTADLDLEELRRFRAKFPVLLDRDPISD